MIKQVKIIIICDDEFPPDEALEEADMMMITKNLTKLLEDIDDGLKVRSINFEEQML